MTLLYYRKMGNSNSQSVTFKAFIECKKIDDDLYKVQYRYPDGPIHHTSLSFSEIKKLAIIIPAKVTML